MISEAYRYKFKEGVSLQEAEQTLLLALLAAEGLHGEARVRLDAAYTVDDLLRVIVVDASSPVGQDVNDVFTTFLTKEFGAGAFHVRRLGQESQS